MKTSYLLCCSVSLLIGIFLANEYHKKSDAQKQATELRLNQEEAERFKFEKEYAPLIKMLNDRDVAIYNYAVAKDVEMMQFISNKVSVIDRKKQSEYRKELEDDLLRDLNIHIEDCKRIISRIQEKNRAHKWSICLFGLFDIYDTRCDCECCRE